MTSFGSLPHGIQSARKAAGLREPAVSLSVLSLIGCITPLYIRLAHGIRGITFLNSKTAVQAFRDFQEGKSRLILAFRHAYGDEPQILAHTLLKVLPRLARNLGLPLQKPVHAHFVHGYEVPLWGGPLIRAVLPRVGAVPIHHTKLDSPSISRIRRIMVDGAYPLALAPEGQTSYTSKRIPRLERGFAHIAAWAMDDLRARNRQEEVQVLPISIHYRYGAAADKIFPRIMAPAEHMLGLTTEKGMDPHRRLTRVQMALLDLAETYYAKHHKAAYRLAEENIPDRPVEKGENNRRWGQVLETALLTAEGTLGLSSEGDTIQRVYRIRHECWDRIYLPAPVEGTSTLSIELAHRAAGEAWYAMIHMEVVDLGFYLDFESHRDDYDPDDLIEWAMNLWDGISRLRGGNFARRPIPGLREAVLVCAEPINMRAVMESHGKDRRSAAEAATSELEKRYRWCIDQFKGAAE